METLLLLDEIINKLQLIEWSYCIGDVIRVLINDKTQQTALAFIDDIDFCDNKYKLKYFNKNSNGYYQIIDKLKLMKSSKLLWNKTKSNAIIKKLKRNKKYNHRLFVKAAKFGDINVVKYIMSTKNYPNNPTIYHYVDKTTQKNKKNKNKTINTKISAFYAAVFYNHLDIVKLFLSSQSYDHDTIKIHCYDEKDKESLQYPKFKRIPNCDVLKCDKLKHVKFYNPELFEKLCKDSNILMLELLLKYDSWPIYCYNSYSLYNVCCYGNLKILKLLLNYIKNPYFINKHLIYNKNHNLIQKFIIPQRNLSLINCAILYKHFEIIKYILIEWKYSKYVIFNEPIYDIYVPHTLPTLLFTILEINDNDINSIMDNDNNFILKFIEFLVCSFDPMESGLNWYCNKSLNKQRQITCFSHNLNDKKCYLFGKLNEKFNDINLFQNNILWINRGLLFGSLMSALIYKIQRLYNDNNNNSKKYIKTLLSILIINGMDLNININNNLYCSYYNRYPDNLNWKLFDLNKDISYNEKFKIFMIDTITTIIENYRKSWLDGFKSCQYAKNDIKLVDIFENCVLDFIVARSDVVQNLKYFELD